MMYSLFITKMHLFLNCVKLPLMLIFFIVEFTPSIEQLDNFFVELSSSRTSSIPIKDFIIYSFQVNYVLATSTSTSNFEVKKFYIVDNK